MNEVYTQYFLYAFVRVYTASNIVRAQLLSRCVKRLIHTSLVRNYTIKHTKLLKINKTSITMGTKHTCNIIAANFSSMQHR